MTDDAPKSDAPKPCRCGFVATDAATPHPCHGNAYTCRKPAKARLYNPRVVAMAGHQMKLEMRETWACDDCWTDYQQHLYRNVLKA